MSVLKKEFYTCAEVKVLVAEAVKQVCKCSRKPDTHGNGELLL